jgi:hypothetical protein
MAAKVTVAMATISWEVPTRSIEAQVPVVLFQEDILVAAKMT